MDALFQKAKNSFDPAEQTKALQEVHEKLVDDALFLWVVHDVAPRAMTPKVKGFVQAQNWFQNLSVHHRRTSTRGARSGESRMPDTGGCCHVRCRSRSASRC